jgi:hypothetical protein
VEMKEHDPYQHPKHEGTARRCVWFGYHSNAEYLEKTVPFLKELKLSLTTITEAACQFYGEFQPEYIQYDYPKIHADLSGFDIALMPEYNNDNPRQRFKSNNKDLTCWALKLPVAKTPEDLTRFMSADERNKEAELRYAEVLKDWTIDKSVNQLKEVIENVKNTRKARK